MEELLVQKMNCQAWLVLSIAKNHVFHCFGQFWPPPTTPPPPSPHSHRYLNINGTLYFSLSAQGSVKAHIDICQSQSQLFWPGLFVEQRNQKWWLLSLQTKVESVLQQPVYRQFIENSGSCRQYILKWLYLMRHLPPALCCQSFPSDPSTAARDQ